MYRYHVEPIQINEEIRTKDLRTLREQEETIVQKLADVAD